MLTQALLKSIIRSDERNVAASPVGEFVSIDAAGVFVGFENVFVLKVVIFLAKVSNSVKGNNNLKSIKNIREQHP